MACGDRFFLVDGGDWCLPSIRGDDGARLPRGRETACQGRPLPRENRQPSPKFAAFNAASKLSALERVSSAAIVIDAGAAQYK